MVEKVGIEPTCPKATGLQPAALPLEHLLHLLCGKGDSRFELELELVESKSTVLTVTLIANKYWSLLQDLNLRCNFLLSLPKRVT